MTQRVQGLPIFVLLVGSLAFSIGYNVVLYNQIRQMVPKEMPSIYQPTEQELRQLEAEILRLENLSKKGYKNTGE